MEATTGICTGFAALLLTIGCAGDAGLDAIEYQLPDDCDELSEMPCGSKLDSHNLLAVAAYDLEEDGRIGADASAGMWDLLLAKDPGQNDAWLVASAPDGRFKDGLIAVATWAGSQPHRNVTIGDRLTSNSSPIPDGATSLYHELYIDCANRTLAQVKDGCTLFGSTLPEWNLFDYGCAQEPDGETEFSTTIFGSDAGITVEGCETPRVYIRVDLRDLPEPTEAEPYSNYRLLIGRN